MGFRAGNRNAKTALMELAGNADLANVSITATDLNALGFPARLGDIGECGPPNPITHYPIEKKGLAGRLSFDLISEVYLGHSHAHRDRRRVL